MKTSAVFSLALMAFGLLVAAGPADAQTRVSFTVPFKFESGTQKFPAGDYIVTKTGDTQLTFRQVSTGKETALALVEKLDAPKPPAAGPRIVFDEMGAFEPSYTEYFTIYVVAEVWLSAGEGYLVHTTKGAHKNTVVSGETKKTP